LLVQGESRTGKELEYTRGSQRHSTLLLGIARQTLRQKAQELGLSVPRLAEAENAPVA
jgi:DNA-binding NtrC family response regulator